MKFKVGDKVRYTGEVSELKKIKYGVVDRLPDLGHIVRYKCTFDYWSSVVPQEELELIEEAKPIKSNRLEELTTALNILGSLGIELDVKIYAEINGKKVSL